MSKLSRRENFFKAIRRENPEKIPFYFNMCDFLIDQFEKKYGTRDYFSYYDMPFRRINVNPTKRKIDYSSYFEGWTHVDEVTEWGLGLQHGSAFHFSAFVGAMECFEDPEQVRQFPITDYMEDYRWEGLAEQIAEYKERDLITVTEANEFAVQIFEPAWYLRGMENLLMDMLSDEEMAEACLDRQTEIMCNIAAKWAEVGVDVIMFGDDVGTERGLMMSVELWRKWLKPRLKKAICAAKEVNPDVIIYYHSDGSIEPLIDELIEVGIEILNPVQPECMDPIHIKERFGDRVSFWGTIGTQTTMPFGTPDEVRRVVRTMCEKVGKGGGLVIAPTHLLEPEVSFENIEALVETVQSFNIEN